MSGFIIKKEHILYIFLAIAVLFAVLPWFKEGIAYTDDFRDHVAHFWYLKNSISEKGRIIFWMQELYSGWPIFQFYSLTPYIISLPFILLFGTVTALKMSIVFSFIVAALSMFFAANLLFKDKVIAFISSIAYTFFSYHFINAGIRGAFNELWGYSLLPLAIAFFIKAINEPNRKNIVLAIISTATIFITHVPTAYALGLFYTAYLIYFFFYSKKITKEFIKTIFFILLGSLLLSSFWLIPFLSESKKVNFTDFYTEKGPKYIGLNVDKGIEFRQLFYRHFENFGRFEDGTKGLYLGYSLLALLALSFFYKNKLSKFFAYLSIFIILLVMTPFLINLMPLISVIHFPFRLLVLLAATMSFVAGTSAKAIIDSIKTKENIKFLIIILIAILIIIDFAPGNKFNWTNQATENFVNSPAQIQILREISNEPGYFLVFAPTAQMAYAYHKKFELGFDWEGFRQGVVGAVHNNYTSDAFAYIDGLKNGNVSEIIRISKNLGYYGVKYIVLPCLEGLNNIYRIAYSNKQFCAYENLFFSQLVISDNATISDLKFDFDKISFSSFSETDSKVIIKVSNFEDHWTAYVGREKTKIRSVWPKFMEITIPKGNHKIELKYHQTKTQIITKIISLLTFIALIIFYFDLDRRKR